MPTVVLHLTHTFSGARRAVELANFQVKYHRQLTQGQVAEVELDWPALVKHLSDLAAAPDAARALGLGRALRAALLPSGWEGVEGTLAAALQGGVALVMASRCTLRFSGAVALVEGLRSGDPRGGLPAGEVDQLGVITSASGVTVTPASRRALSDYRDALREHAEEMPWLFQKLGPARARWVFASVMFAEWVGARLPLEPKWEYACRAGKTTRFWSGDTKNDLARVGWTKQNSDGHPHPVAQNAQKAWGLHDVHGNVWEWCLNDRGDYARRADGLTVDSRRLTFAVGTRLPEPADSAARGTPRVLHGGSWRSRSDSRAPRTGAGACPRRRMGA